MKRRVCIFSFYNKNGIVSEYIYRILEEIMSVSDRIIFVTNGIIREESKIKVYKYTNEIIVRKNCGFDAGAYKDVITEYLNLDMSDTNELILCNDTFWGFSYPLIDIFKEMNSKNVDFWGLSLESLNYVHIIPSFFLVFSNAIVTDKNFALYFKKNIDDSSCDICSAYSAFEVGLFKFLVDKGYSYSGLCDIDNIDFYKEPDTLLILKKYPIIKRKTAISNICDLNKLINCLSYLKANNYYDVNLIIKDLDRNYNLKIDVDSISKQINISNNKLIHFYSSKVSSDEINQFILSSDNLYIYGAGIIGCRLYECFAKNNCKFKGFIVSDDKMCNRKEFMFQRLYHFSEIDLREKYIIVAIANSSLMGFEYLLSSAYTLYM